MRKIFLLLIMMFPVSLAAQDKEPDFHAILYDVRHVLYQGIDNSVALNTLDTSYNWKFTCSNGTVQAWGRNHLKVHPVTLERNTITATYQVAGKTKEVSFTFLVVPLPQPAVWIKTKNDSLSKAELLNIGELKCHIPNIQYYIPYNIKSFKIQVFRDGKLIAAHENTGGDFSKELTATLNKLSKGDLVVITDVIAERNDKAGDVAAKPTTFYIN